MITKRKHSKEVVLKDNQKIVDVARSSSTFPRNDDDDGDGNSKRGRGVNTINDNEASTTSPLSSSTSSSAPAQNPPTKYVNEIVLNQQRHVGKEETDEDENTLPTILIASPMRQREHTIQRYFDLIEGLDYPKDKLSWAVLVGDSTDRTEEILTKKFRTLTDFRKVMVVKKDFNFEVKEHRRHEEHMQHERRSFLAQIRNSLIVSALTDEEWVLWIDSDVFSFEPNMLKRLLEVRKDIVVPHIVMPNGRTYDLNSWKETDASRAMQKKLRAKDVLVEGYHGLETYRKHMGDFSGVEELDGVGGAVLLVRGEAHRRGLIFPPFPFQHQLETEALGKMAREMGYVPYGTTDIKVIHK
eukprot:m.86001 g.86001  ORF g.86001 m.86001 type:complete len:355 (-) comp12204_c0_seq4:54-1118(-)